MSPLEQKLLNAFNVLVDAGAELVAANNPAYASLIGVVTGAADHINQQVNPTAPDAAQSIATTAAAISGSVAPSIAAIKTIKSNAGSAQDKATAIGSIVAAAESIGTAILGLFKK